MKKAALFLMLLVAAFAGSCSKDNIESKTDDISRSWKISEYSRTDGQADASTFEGARFDIRKDGTYSYNIPGLGQENGNWAFNDDGSKLILDKGTADEETIDILELSSKKLKTTTVHSGNVTENVTYVPA